MASTIRSAHVSSSALCLAAHRSGDGRAELVGYAHLVSGEAPAAVRGPAPMEIERLYVDLARYGQRVAQTLWLGVWEQRPRAVAFYATYRVVRVGEPTVVLGSDAQTDRLFARVLNASEALRVCHAGSRRLDSKSAFDVRP